MPVPIMGALLSMAAPELAKRGLDVLSGIFRGATQRGAEKIVEAVKDKTGIDVSSEVQGVADLIKEKTGIEVADIADNKLSSDQWVKLKEFELQNEGQLQKVKESVATHELEMEKALNEDRADARKSQIERDKNSDKFISRFIYWYAYIITGLTFAFIVAALALGPENPASPKWRLIDTVLGFLLGVGVSAIIQFFYGSSMGSKDKSETIRRIREQEGQ